MTINSTQELFVHELAEVYDAEHRFVEGQQEMIQNATDEDLKGAIREHLAQTEQHAANVERVFAELGLEAHRRTNAAAQGLVVEAQEAMQEANGGALRDCAIVSSVIKVEHFEMASYRGLVTGAKLMGQDEVERLLKENMQQEEETARTTERSAEELLQKAMQGDEHEEGQGLMDKAKDKLMGH